MSWLWWVLGALGVTGGGIGIAALLGGGPFMLLIAGKGTKALWTWLSHRSFWQIVAGILAIFAIIQHFQLIDARHDTAKSNRQRDELKRQLDAISTKRNDQRIETQTRIETVTKVIHDAEERAKVVEQAPLPGNCKTPPEVMGADL